MKAQGISQYTNLTVLPIVAAALVVAIGCKLEYPPQMVGPPSRADYADVVGLSDPSAPNELLLSWISTTLRPNLAVTGIEQAAIDELRSTAAVFDCTSHVIDEELKRALIEAPHLVWLQIGSKAAPDDLLWIRDMHNLRGLSLREADLRHADLQLLQSLTQLQWLSLMAAQLPHTSDRGLPSLPRLEVLIMNDADVTDEQLPALGQFPQLKVLGIRSSSITDDGVRRLVQANPGLRYLHLSWSSGVTCDSEVPLSSLRYLKWLHVGSTALERSLLADGERGLRRFQRSLPECYIGVGD